MKHGKVAPSADSLSKNGGGEGGRAGISSLRVKAAGRRLKRGDGYITILARERVVQNIRVWGLVDRKSAARHFFCHC